MDVVIAGAGGHGRIVLDILQMVGEHRVVGFLDANVDVHGTTVNGVPVLGDVSLLPKLRRDGVRGGIVGIGDNLVRITYARKILAGGLELVNAIHPSTVVSAMAEVGRNVVAAAGSIICTGARIHDSVIVNTGAIVDHECLVEEAAHLAPGVKLAGRVTVETAAFVGLNACVLPCLKVGSRAVVGAGAVVIRDVAPGSTVVGIPAMPIQVLNGGAAVARRNLRPSV